MIRLSDRVHRRHTAIAAEVDGELVALDIHSGVCFGLNSTATRVWALIESPVQVSDICATLVDEYEVTPEVCEAQTLQLLNSLSSEGLLIVERPASQK